MNQQAQLEQRVCDREQESDPILREHIDHGDELLGTAIVDRNFGRHMAHETAAGRLHLLRGRDQRRDILLAGDDPLEIALDAEPSIVFHRHRARAHLMRDPKHVDRDSVDARG